jgi:hypothetical protein
MGFSKRLRTLALGVTLTVSAVGMPALHAFAAAPQGGAPLPQHLAPVVTSALVSGASNDTTGRLEGIGIPISPIYTLTQTENGTTVAVAVGQTVALSLPMVQLNWSVSVSDQSVLVPVAGPLPTGDQGLWQLAAASPVVITATGRPVCNPDAVCPQFIVHFQATVN